MSKEETKIENENKLEEINVDDIDKVVGGKGFVVEKEIVIGSDNKTK